MLSPMISESRDIGGSEFKILISLLPLHHEYIGNTLKTYAAALPSSGWNLGNCLSFLGLLHDTIQKSGFPLSRE
jgi:hypothetical protein